MQRGSETREELAGRNKEGTGGSNGYSRINSSIMSSASEFPRHGERLEIIKQSDWDATGPRGGSDG